MGLNAPDLIPPRRRTASLPDISQYIPSPKRLRLDGLNCPPEVHMKYDVIGEASMHDPVADEIYRMQVLIELDKKLEEITEFDTHGLKTDRLILGLLQKAGASKHRRTGSTAALKACRVSPSQCTRRASFPDIRALVQRLNVRISASLGWN